LHKSVPEQMATKGAARVVGGAEYEVAASATEVSGPPVGRMGAPRFCGTFPYSGPA